ncbi:hypothetical protein DPEC_G00309650 [Dallia pectoralis]|uniref:Uncharacterized protein n=1 Tax=Dallia pectoralis TaxID=75939 RepID=A0ACC2FEZ4_DALPE|nr:hypothetical protein DPEC_G00309650 [Dallia pectoralis]
MIAVTTGVNLGIFGHHPRHLNQSGSRPLHPFLTLLTPPLSHPIAAAAGQGGVNAGGGLYYWLIDQRGVARLRDPETYRANDWPSNTNTRRVKTLCLMGAWKRFPQEAALHPQTRESGTTGME